MTQPGEPSSPAFSVARRERPGIEGRTRPLHLTNLVVAARDGREVSGQALVGAIVVGGDGEGGRNAFRIEKVWTDADDPEITLYDLSISTPGTSVWQRYCGPDNRGVAAGFFLSGSWDARSTHLHDGRFSIACTGGAIGKCVRWGFKPWKPFGDGGAGWDYHQACMRLVRADYCGNGRSHTRNGVPIEILSRFDRAEQPGGGLEVEAAWMPEGAACLARPRLVSWSLEDIVAECPERLRGRVGHRADCGMAQLDKPEVLFVNKSPPGTR